MGRRVDSVYDFDNKELKHFDKPSDWIKFPKGSPADKEIDAALQYTQEGQGHGYKAYTIALKKDVGLLVGTIGV